MSTTEISADEAASAPPLTTHAAIARMRIFVAMAGLATALAFVVVGVAAQLQTYGDGSIFSYAVAAQDVWAFHWRNIAVRATPWLLAMAPAEGYVALTGDLGGGVALYGALFFAAPAAGLAATFALDRSPGRIFFLLACFSTACFCPLVFGFPTEMWFAHALFWPTLAAAFYARTIARGILVFGLLLALIFSHEGALILAGAVVVGLALRGLRDPSFVIGAIGLTTALAIWIAVDALVQPDDYFAAVRIRAALEFFDLHIFGGLVVRLIVATLLGYAAVSAVLRRCGVARPQLLSAALVLAALAFYWLKWDSALHAENRYYARTILLLTTCAMGALAVLFVLRAEGALGRSIPLLSRITDRLAGAAGPVAICGALALVMSVHAVETTKFVSAWGRYRTAVRTLATGVRADPQLGDPAFVSSARIDRDLDRLAWFSTTPYLAALVSDFQPTRLVVDPVANYFWISCATAQANFARRSLPAASAGLVRAYACAHR